MNINIMYLCILNIKRFLINEHDGLSDEYLMIKTNNELAAVYYQPRGVGPFEEDLLAICVSRDGHGKSKIFPKNSLQNTNMKKGRKGKC